MDNEVKKPVAAGKSFIYFGSLESYVLGFREETEKFIVHDGIEELEFDNVFRAVEEILINCGYEINKIKETD